VSATRRLLLFLSSRSFQLGQPLTFVPLPHHAVDLEDNLSSVHVQISAEEHKEIRALINDIQVSGERYAPSQMSSVNA
jgi:hypothetical protein